MFCEISILRPSTHSLFFFLFTSTQHTTDFPEWLSPKRPKTPQNRKRACLVKTLNPLYNPPSTVHLSPCLLTSSIYSNLLICQNGVTPQKYVCSVTAKTPIYFSAGGWFGHPWIFLKRYHFCLLRLQQGIKITQYQMHVTQ